MISLESSPKSTCKGWQMCDWKDMEHVPWTKPLTCIEFLVYRWRKSCLKNKNLSQVEGWGTGDSSTRGQTVWLGSLFPTTALYCQAVSPDRKGLIKHAFGIHGREQGEKRKPECWLSRVALNSGATFASFPTLSGLPPQQHRIWRVTPTLDPELTLGGFSRQD